MLTLPEIQNAADTAILVDGGFTYDPRTESFIRAGEFPHRFTGHYAVAVPGTESTDFQHLIEQASIRSFINGVDTFVGGWRDHNGKLWLELSELVIGHEHAIELGKLRKQLAIMDMTTGEEITL